jgi:hypothetical protein
MLGHISSVNNKQWKTCWGWLFGAFVSYQTLLILEVVNRNTRVGEIAYGFGGPSEKNVSPP